MKITLELDHLEVIKLIGACNSAIAEEMQFLNGNFGVRSTEHARKSIATLKRIKDKIKATVVEVNNRNETHT